MAAHGLIAEGRSVALTSAIIARSTLVAVPAIALATYLYSVWSTKRALIVAIAITTPDCSPCSCAARDRGMVSNPVVSVSLLIVGTSWVISFLLPYPARELLQ